MSSIEDDLKEREDSEEWKNIREIIQDFAEVIAKLISDILFWWNKGEWTTEK